MKHVQEDITGNVHKKNKKFHMEKLKILQKNNNKKYSEFFNFNPAKYIFKILMPNIANFCCIVEINKYIYIKFSCMN